MNDRAYRDLDKRVDRLEMKSNRYPETGYPVGSTFPTGISSGFIFYRIDLGFLCYYDGTRWLTSHEYQVDLSQSSGIANPLPDASYVNNQSIMFIPSRADWGIYYTYSACWINVATTNNGTNYWVLELTNTGTSLATFSTIADAAGTNLYKTDNTGAALATGRQYWQLRTSNNVGTPGAISYQASAFYRLIIT